MDDIPHHHHAFDTTTPVPASIAPSHDVIHITTFQVWTPTTLLFHSWSLDSIHGLGTAVALSVFLSVVYEGSKFYYHIGKILHHRGPNNRWHGALVAHYVSRMWKALAYMIHFLIGYILMLCSMTFNLWILAAICLGTGTGYFFLLPLIQHVLHRNTDDVTHAAREHNVPITSNERLEGTVTSNSTCSEIEVRQQHGAGGDDMERLEMTNVARADVHVDDCRHGSGSVSAEVEELSKVDCHKTLNQKVHI